MTVEVTAGPADLDAVGLSLESQGVTADASAVTITPDQRSGFSLAAGASRSFTFKAKSSKAGKVEIKVTATGNASTGAVSGWARTGFVVKRKAYAIEMTGIERAAKIGPLPKPLSPDKVAFGDTVDFALSGWDPAGGPISVSWGDKSLGKLAPNQVGAADPWSPSASRAGDIPTRWPRRPAMPLTLNASHGRDGLDWLKRSEPVALSCAAA